MTESEVLKCKFKAISGKGEQCQENPSTSFGFCKKHRNTVQANRAKQAMEEANNRVEEVTELELYHHRE